MAPSLLQKTKIKNAQNQHRPLLSGLEFGNKHFGLSACCPVRFLCRPCVVHHHIGHKVSAWPCSVHGIDVVENQLSGYYLADEISGTYRGMMIAIDEAQWVVFQHMIPLSLPGYLKIWRLKVKLSAFLKHPRGPKKPQPKRKSCKNTPHVSTAKILAQ